MMRNRPARQLASLAAVLPLCAACTTPRPRRGDINLVYGLTGQERALFEVEQGRILSQWLDVATQTDGPDSCVRGTWNAGSVSLCPKELDPADSHFGGKLVQWQGPTGLLAIEVSPKGDAVRIDGHISRSNGTGHSLSDASVHSVGQGGGRHGGEYGLSGPDNLGVRSGNDRPVVMHITLPLGHGPQWDEIRRYPVLYAVAAASIGIVRGESVPKSKQPSETRAGDASNAAAEAPPEPSQPAAPASSTPPASPTPVPAPAN